MRWLMLAVVVSLGFAAWVGVSAVTAGAPGNPETAESHKPETDEERAVARVATAHVRKLIRGRSVYVESELELDSVGIHDGGRASATFTGLIPGPAVTVRLRLQRGTWRAISHDSYGVG
jgi:hypothetical protein